MKTIDVMVFEPGMDGEVREIENSLEGMQAVVGGYIESVTLSDTLVAICNEEGRLIGLPTNRFGFVGTFFITRSDGGEDFTNLTADDLKVINGFVERNEELVYTGPTMIFGF